MNKQYNHNMSPVDCNYEVLPIVGRMAYVHLHRGIHNDIPAKIDTGADASAIDASIIRVNDKGELEYVLFRPGYNYYDGTLHTTKNFTIKVVKSSTGHVQIRYTVRIPVYIESKKIIGTFTLTDRSKNMFPILIGAKLLRNKFIVDVSCKYPEYRQYLSQFKDSNNTITTTHLTRESKQNPVAFYKNKYLEQDVE